MANLKLDEKTARQLYPTADPLFKAILDESFPKETLSQKITDRVKDFSDIIAISGAHLLTFVSKDGEPNDEVAYRKIKLIAKVYNEGVVLDPGNTNQYKYFPWFEIVKDRNKPSGFGLSCGGGAGWDSVSTVGGRLCFATKELAIDAGKKFIDIYEQYLIR